jgi:hypothetical protein
MVILMEIIEETNCYTTTLDFEESLLKGLNWKEIMLPKLKAFLAITL